MLDSRNVVNLTGGVVRDPESPTANLVKFSIAVDYAGSEKDGSNTGYFDVIYWLNDDNPNTKFVKSQLDAGNLKKGSQIQLLGRLQQERWTSDDSKKSKVVIVAESLSYASRGTGATSASGSSAEVPAEF